jgi:hypothetical protein
MLGGIDFFLGEGMRKTIISVMLIVLVVIATGCSAPQRTLKMRASFDLDCPIEQLNINRMGINTIGVSGCGKEAAYTEKCQSDFWSAPVCSWVIDQGQPKK